MSKLNSVATNSALSAASSTTYAAVTGGNGSEGSPYILASNTGTITLKPGAWYVLPNGASIGTVVTHEFNTSGSTGGIKVNGAHLEIQTDAHVAGTIDMSGKGSFMQLDNTSGKWVYQANMPGVDISAGGDNMFTYPALQNAIIHNFGSGAGICAQDIPGGYGNVGAAGTYSQSGSQLIIKGSSSIPVSPTSANHWSPTQSGTIGVPLYVGPNAPNTPYYVDPSNHCQIDGCFLSGTQILTRDGEKTVETLVEGDEIAVLKDGEIAYSPLAWLGRSHADVAKLGFEKDAYPVRIRKDAFGEGMPHRDLLVTSEHSILMDGKLVPVRMLVNGRSIVIDRSITDYDFYHVELEEHAVIVSEGLATESYLDTGNRGTFHNSAIRSMRPHFAGGNTIVSGKSWAEDAAAPLVTDRDTVEPLWQGLVARAEELGFAAETVTTTQVSDPAIRLVMEDGREIRPLRHMDNVYSFMVPADATTARIVSRTFRPSEVTGPFCDDRRDLGVLVGAINVTSARNRTVVAGHLAAGALDGWNGFEGSVARWTAGNALIDLGAPAGGTVTRMVEIEVLGAGPYLVDATEEGVRVA